MIFLILIFSIICLIFYNNYENYQNISDKPFVWVYWEGPKSPLIQLCIEIMTKKLSDNFNFILLDQNNIYNYLPDIKEDFKKVLNSFKISHKVDYYRILLLQKFGGIYLDADVIVLKNLSEIIDKLKDYDYVGFGCTGIQCFNGYGNPSNWAMASRKNGVFISKVREAQENILEKIINGEIKYSKNNDELNYHFIGKLPMWKVLEDLIKNNNYKYFHYDNDYTGIRDRDGYWIHNLKIISNENLNYNNTDKMMFFVFYNSEMGDGVDEYFKNKSKEDLINDNTNLAKFLKKGLL